MGVIVGVVVGVAVGVSSSNEWKNDEKLLENGEKSKINLWE